MPFPMSDQHLDELDPPTGLRDTRPPPAPAILRRGRGVWYWVVPRCPLCRGEHRHGGGALNGDPRQYLGHRVGHCDSRRVDADGPDGYVLVDADPARTVAVLANHHGALSWLERPGKETPDPPA